jgi:hypothetical protein
MSGRDPGLERLAAGVLLPGFVGLSPPRWLVAAIEDGLAGVVYFGPNISSPSQVSALSAELHAGRDDVLIAADEEGGDVTRLHAVSGSDLPGNAALGAVDDEDVTASAARAIARELRLAGVDVDLAPCVDVNCDPANPVIGCGRSAPSRRWWRGTARRSSAGCSRPGWQRAPSTSPGTVTPGLTRTSRCPWCTPTRRRCAPTSCRRSLRRWSPAHGVC